MRGIVFAVLALLGTTIIAVMTPSETLAIGGIPTIDHLRSGSIDDQIIKAPISISGDNVYVVWWANKTGNDEVNFRASTDGGASFGDKIILSNSTNTESQDVEIDTDGDNVVVTWWERNQTSDTPVMRTSNDNGATFGPILVLAINGTIGEAEGGPSPEEE